MAHLLLSMVTWSFSFILRILNFMWKKFMYILSCSDCMKMYTILIVLCNLYEIFRSSYFSVLFHYILYTSLYKTTVKGQEH
jgi:hypothetical protein